jgi:D-cysteine desulfhydrase
MNPTNRHPRMALGLFPTPLHRAMRLRDDGSFVLKRDDLTGFGLAGNKARPLEFLTADALAQGCDMVVTGGAPTSNFIGALAQAAYVAGIPCEVLLASGSETSVPVQLARACDANVLRVECDRSLIDDAIEKRVCELESQGRRPYLVPRGGANAVGALGFANAAFEILAQTEVLGIEPSMATIVLPTGSGASLAGFVAGSEAAGLNWRVIGVSVSRPVEQISADIERLTSACSEIMGTTPASRDAFKIVDRAGGKHAGERDNRSARLMRKREGILLDPHYGAPAFDFALELPASQREPVVLWLTGGIPLAIDGLDLSDSIASGYR